MATISMLQDTEDIFHYLAMVNDKDVLLHIALFLYKDECQCVFKRKKMNEFTQLCGCDLQIHFKIKPI